MLKGAVKFGDMWIAPGSEAMRLLQEKRYKELIDHIAFIKKKDEDLVKRCKP